MGSDHEIYGSDDAGVYAGSTALVPFGNETHVLTRSDAAFDLLSLDFSEQSSVDPSRSLVFTGNIAGGGAVSATLLSDGVFGFEGYLFSGFTGLSLVVFTVTAADGAIFQYDNIVVQASAVPLPAALPLSLLGLAALGLIGRRRVKA
ncbi:MAG: hypothetical protein ACJA1L_002115 [Paracoccaceae bacterium]